MNRSPVPAAQRGLRLATRGLLAACAAFVLTAWPAAASAQADDAAIVDCLFPGQVRRLGAFSSAVTPRRQARVPASECRAGGGEYTETVKSTPPPSRPQEAHGSDGASVLQDVALWLPLAAAGVSEAQVRAGELYEHQGDGAQARRWYEAAVLQGSARAMVNLAAMYEQGTGGLARDLVHAQALIIQAVGLPLVGRRRDDRPRIELVAPATVIRTPRAATRAEITLDAPEGPLQVTGHAESPAGIASVDVNGQAMAMDANGLFAVPVSLGGEPVSLKVTAVDKAGASDSTEFVLRRGFGPASTAAPTLDVGSGFGKRLALVIANQNYRRWERLDTPAADGRDVAEVLHRRFGFEVTLLADATRRDMLAALSQLRMKAGPDDQVIVYYAGHGQMDPVTARGYWIPVDGELHDLSNWVSVIDVTDQLSAMQARQALVIADSCYSGTLAGSLSTRIDAALSSEQRQRNLNQLSSRRSRVAFTSGGLEPVVDGGGEGAHSIFASSLLDVLATVNSPVGAQELADIVAARFSLLGKPLQVKQRPHYAPIAFAGHEAGDFVLSPRP